MYNNDKGRTIITLNSYKTPHKWHCQTIYGACIVSILDKIDSHNRIEMNLENIIVLWDKTRLYIAKVLQKK